MRAFKDIGYILLTIFNTLTFLIGVYYFKNIISFFSNYFLYHSYYSQSDKYLIIYIGIFFTLTSILSLALSFVKPFRKKVTNDKLFLVILLSPMVVYLFGFLIQDFAYYVLTAILTI